MVKTSETREKVTPILIDEEGNKYIPVKLEEIQDQNSGRTIKPDSERITKLYTP